MILHHLDDYFIETYAELFENPEEIAEGSIFWIDKSKRQLVRCHWEGRGAVC